jgi:hypothetical protein
MDPVVDIEPVLVLLAGGVKGHLGVRQPGVVITGGVPARLSLGVPPQ